MSRAEIMLFGDQGCACAVQTVELGLLQPQGLRDGLHTLTLG